jgi:RNA polymerase sigma-70 factor (ECF subfamily)
MPAEGSFDDLMARLQAGDEAAAAAVFHRFAQRLIALARAHLDARLRQKVDPEDVLQSIYRTFFRRHAAGQFDLRSWDGLWALLTVITVRKCGQWGEHFYPGRRDLGREAAAEPVCGATDPLAAAEAREPTPSEVFMLTETVEHLLRGLGPREREIVSLALQGHTAQEVSALVGRPERTVYRVLERIRKQLERLQAESGGTS